MLRINQVSWFLRSKDDISGLLRPGLFASRSSNAVSDGISCEVS